MDNKLIGLVSIFFLIFGVFISVLFFNKNIATLTRAKEELVPVTDKSILLAYPLTVTANDQENSTITVWVRNEKGVGIINRNVTLTSNLGTLDQTSKTTDNKGQATFTIHSASVGNATISGKIDGVTSLANTVTINFVSP